MLTYIWLFLMRFVCCDWFVLLNWCCFMFVYLWCSLAGLVGCCFGWWFAFVCFGVFGYVRISCFVLVFVILFVVLCVLMLRLWLFCRYNMLWCVYFVFMYLIVLFCLRLFDVDFCGLFRLVWLPACFYFVVLVFVVICYGLLLMVCKFAVDWYLFRWRLGFCYVGAWLYCNSVPRSGFK